MGTYQIPRNYRGESRILYIFTVKSLITTAVGAMVGSLFFLLFKSLNMTPVGIGCMAFFAFIGFALGALKVPTIVMFPITIHEVQKEQENIYLYKGGKIDGK